LESATLWTWWQSMKWLDATGAQAADVPRRLEEQYRGAVARSGSSRRDTARTAAVNDHIVR